ncbi:amidase signature enzyme [Xylariomycetidae sp. FL2044]|nr:amidase signature enzyme [Xylariomycetidae sp. FL2044]
MLSSNFLIAAEALAATIVFGSPLSVENLGREGSFSFTFAGLGDSPRYYVPGSNSSDQAVLQVTAASHSHFAARSAPGEIAYTAFSTAEHSITSQVLQDLLSKYLEDDVYTAQFLDGASLEDSALTWLAGNSVQRVVVSKAINVAESLKKSNMTILKAADAEDVPPGPYIASFGGPKPQDLHLSRVYALVADPQEAYMQGCTANGDGSFAAVDIWDPARSEFLIPVPSRLYWSKLDRTQYPLAGLRFAVKDLMPMRGLRTSGGSRAYLRLHGTPAADTTPAVQQLIDLGAVPVGKTKLTVFAFGAWPWQTDDFAYSWNPRADGYLGLSASSYGSAAAIAAYDYLDFTIGSDTGGSVRNPADRVGVYGMRPTWSAINTSLVIPSASSLDALGFFTRSPALMRHVGKAWETSTNAFLRPGNFTLPKKIFFPVDFFPVNNSAAQDIIDTWLRNVSSALDMTIEEQNVTRIFAETVAASANNNNDTDTNTNTNTNTTLADYTADIFDLSTYDNYHLFGRSFLAEYATGHGGRIPPLDLPAQQAYAAAPALTAADKAAREQRRQDFEDFFNAHVLPPSSSSSSSSSGGGGTCSEGLWVYHISDKGGGVPEYRDVITYDYFPEFEPMRGASIAPFAKLVDVTVPIGFIGYDSVISGREEPLAITLNIVAHKGCDFVVLDFLQACAEARLCLEVKTGRSAF